MSEVKIIHISDLHLSEHLTKGPEKHFRLPHRYGHSISSFLALDHYLRNDEWDFLIITGDISRIGNPESFEAARNWLENNISLGEYELGLNLSKTQNKYFLIVPGNHDRFNGNMTQSSLDNYTQEFKTVKIGSSKEYLVNGLKINFHFYDSSYPEGNFGLGYIDEKHLIPKRISDDQINIAMLHHHFIQPPKHTRSRTTEIINSTRVASYMLHSGFNMVLFGHTHKSYIGYQSVEILSGLLNDGRTVKGFWDLVKRRILGKDTGSGLLAYKRDPAQNGQYPTMDSYFDFLYLTKKGYKLNPPSYYKNIKQFYEQMNNTTSQLSIKRELASVKQKKILISLAPSACQAEARWNGFHKIIISKENDSHKYTWSRYQFDGNTFVKKGDNEHLS